MRHVLAVPVRNTKNVVVRQPRTVSPETGRLADSDHDLMIEKMS